MSTQSGEAERRRSIRDLAEMKRRNERIAMLTAYDYLFAKLVDRGGADVILVGDSLANVVMGLDSTLPVTVEDMIHHAAAVCRGVRHALVIVDMPFLSYQVRRSEAVRNAGRILQQTGAAGVKVEGASAGVLKAVEAMVETGIPVMAHLGFTPQAVHTLGGFRVQGRSADARARLLEDALRLQDAGAFSLVLELVPGEAAEEVTSAVDIPTIGIGAGAGCDGQVLVLHDMLGLNAGFRPKFLRRFAEIGEAVERGVTDYVRAVKTGEYPAEEHTFH